MRTFSYHLKRHKYHYMLLILPLLQIIVFFYIPIGGLVIAFQKYNVFQGIRGSNWVGLNQFREFLQMPYFYNLLKNTLLLGLYNLVFGFPVPIILALMLNEVRTKWFKNTIQTVSYLPQFVSSVVIVSLFIDILSIDHGTVNDIISAFGFPPIDFIKQSGWFRPVFTVMSIYQYAGWTSIVYLAALTNVDTEVLEAATIDGAGRMKKIGYIILPTILPTIMIMLILQIGGIMGSDYQKVLLLYNPLTYDTADVIGTYVFRRGLIEGDYSFATAIGLVESVIAFVLLYSANALSKKLTRTSFL